MADAQVQANDEQEIAEAQNSLADLLYDVVAQAATTRLGAFVYRRIDSVLSTVEKTAKWSLPQPAPTAPPAQPAPAQEGVPAEEGGQNQNPDADNNARTGKISAPPLIRPLPWMLFLPALVVMRMVRICLSLLALMVGRPPVTPASVVYFVQNKRRKLRALKYRGQKLNRISRAEAKAEDELQTTWLSRITMPLRMIVCRPGRVQVTPHRHHHHRRQQNHQQQQQQQQQQNQQQQQDQQPGRKRNAHERDIDDDSEVDESTVNELLDKYADADGDSSFHADSGSSDSSDTSLSEQEKSTVEDGPSKQPPAEPTSSTKKESNGHAPKEGVPQARRKSDLNVESDPKPKPAENGSVDGAKKQDAAKEPAIKESEKDESKDAKPKAAENGPSDGSKSQDTPKEERQKSESNKPKSNPPASGSESTDSKQTSAAGQKNQQEEDAAKNQSMSDVKSNFQQKNKQQQQQQQQQNQPQNQPQHANGGSKKQKRPSQGHQ